MKIGILGAGNVGTTLGRGLARAGHELLYAVREPDRAELDALRRDGAAVLAVRDTVERADLVLLATPWASTEAALASAGDFQGKPLLDATNPIGPGLSLTHGHTDSGAEQVARWAKGAKVVKVFNTTGVENMANPEYPDGRVAMFICGDDARACAIALELCHDLGFEAIRVGGLAMARVLEPAAMLWIQLAIVLGNGRNIGFGLLRRDEG